MNHDDLKKSWLGLTRSLWKLPNNFFFHHHNKNRSYVVGICTKLKIDLLKWKIITDPHRAFPRVVLFSTVRLSQPSWRQETAENGARGHWKMARGHRKCFRVPLPFSNVPLPHFLPPLALKKAVKKMGMEFIIIAKFSLFL